ncbi:MAG: ABC transporter ATP-binding protein/permease [Candidatus Dadabacteria bacterium]|nr:ABC transporter ATP-binding protein/permease [Candidatus Dadabacteria bacterium]
MDQEEEKSKKISYDIKILRWLLRFTFPYKRFMVLSLVFMVITAMFELVLPYVTKIAVDNYIFPSWREARFLNENKDKGFENWLKEKYPSALITLDNDIYLIDLSKVSKDDKITLERLGIVSKEKYLVINIEEISSNNKESVPNIIKRYPDVFRSVGGFFVSNYSSLKKLSGEDVRLLREHDINRLDRLALFLFLMLTAILLFSSLYTYLLQYSGQRIMHRIRVGVFSHLLTLPQPFFDKNPVGRLTTRVTNDVNAINEMYTSVIVQFFKDLLVILGVLVVMFNMNRNLTLIIITLTIIFGIVGLIFRMKLKSVYRNVRKSIAKLNAFVQESIRGVTIIRLYNRESENFLRFSGVNQENYKANMDQLFAFATFRPIIEFLSTIAIALILWYGGLSILKLDLTIGALIAYLAYIRMLFGPIVELAERYNILQSAVAASENLYELGNVKPEERDKGRGLEKVNGTLEFKNVWFSYNGSDWVLKDVSFTVKPGETVALVGLTGSGKTTIVNLILKFYEIQKGEILFDGVDIRELAPDFLRANVSTVFQDHFLFGKNLNDDLSNGEVFARVTDTEDLLNSDVHSISSGEKQIVSLGIAFSKDASFLILDEATSHVDAEIELKVRELLKNDSRKRTTIIVAHRLSNVREADKIIVIHNGEVFEVGTHYELLMKRGIYHNLYRLQNEIHRSSSQTEYDTGNGDNER